MGSPVPAMSYSKESVSRPFSPASSTVSSMTSEIAFNKYLMKTLCFSKKSQTMPGKEEYSALIQSGLGARKWQVPIEMEADAFHNALLNIYPRLSGVTSYTLWTINKHKEFEKLPAKVNTPKRFRSYLGSQYSGCLIIMPNEEIPLYTPSDTLEMEKRKEKISKERKIPSGAPMDYRSINPHSSHNGLSSLRIQRSICALCGRMAKQAVTNAFFDIEKDIIATEKGPVPIGQRIRELLNIDLPKPKLVASDEICKRCYRQLCEIDYMEAQTKRFKEDLVHSFFTTVSKISKVSSTGGGNLWEPRPHTSEFSAPPPHHSPTPNPIESRHIVQAPDGYIFAPGTDLHQNNINEMNALRAQRVYLTPSAYREAFGSRPTEFPSSVVPVYKDSFEYDREAPDETKYAPPSEASYPESDSRSLPRSMNEISGTNINHITESLLRRKAQQQLQQQQLQQQQQKEMSDAASASGTAPLSSQLPYPDSPRSSSSGGSRSPVAEQTGLDLSCSPRQPWKKRHREISTTSKAQEETPAKMPRNESEQSFSRTTTDSGNGPSDEDCSSSSSNGSTGPTMDKKQFQHGQPSPTEVRA